MKDPDLIEVLRNAFVWEQANGDDANIVSAIHHLGTALRDVASDLGNGGASTPMGAIEAHGKCVLEAAASISDSLEAIAGAIQDLAEAIKHGA